MKYLYFYCISILLLLLINCSTPYQPKGILGGYSEKQLDNNCYEVSFWGNQHTNPDDVDKYLLYRCAELSQDKGYEYFAIIGESRDCKKQRHFVGGSRQKIGGSRNNRGGGVGGNIQFYEYDFSYIIMLCDEVKSISNDTYSSSKVLQDLAVFINNKNIL